MHRRNFLHAASLAVASSTLPGAVSAAFAAQAGSVTDPRLQLLRADAGVAGAPFLQPLTYRGGQAGRAMVHIDKLHAADGGAVLARLELHAIFAQADGSEAPFLAWQHGAAAGASRSDRVRFSAPGNALRRFEVGYQLAGDPAACTSKCVLAGVDAGALQPGQYVLLGPRRDGRPVDTWGLSFTGDAEQPLRSRGRDYDYLALRVVAA